MTDHVFLSSSREARYRARRSTTARWLSAAVLGAMGGGALAAIQNPASLQILASQFLTRQSANLVGEVSVTVESPRATSLAACTAPQAFIPPGAARVGKTVVGVRCAAPAQWTVYLPARVSQHAPYAVTARALPPGHVLAESDLVAQHGDLGRLAPDVISELATLPGQQLVSGMAAGAALRQGLVRPPPVARQGQILPLLVKGPGFAVRTQGVALANARAGEALRLKSANGAVVSGVVGADGLVIVNF